MSVTNANIIYNPSWKQLSILSTVLALFTSIFFGYLYLLIPIASVFYAIRENRINELVVAVFSALLIFTSNNFESLRIYLNIFALLLLLFLYFRKNGFTIATLPDEVIYLFLVVIFSIVIPLFATGIEETSQMALFRQLIFFVIIYLFINIIDRRRIREVTYYILLTVAFVISVSVLLEILLNEPVDFTSIIFSRYSGLYNNPNGVGLIIAAVIPLLLSAYLRTATTTAKVFKFILLLFFASVLLLSNSRASILAAVVSSAIVIYFFDKRILKRIAIGGVSLLLIILLLVPLREFLFEFFRLDRISDARILYWNISWDIVKANPIFGSGPDLFGEYIYKYLPVRLNSFMEALIWHGRTGTAHNFFLFRLSELGIWGLISAFYFVYIIYILSIRVIKYYAINSKEELNGLIPVFAVIIGFLVRSLFESTGLITHGWITRDLPFWLCFSVIVSHYSEIINKSVKIENKFSGS